MMTCEEAREATVLAAYGELTPARRDDLAGHLRSCASCAAESREVNEARRLIARAEGHALPATWGSATTTTPAGHPWRRLMPLAAAASLLAVSAAWWMTRHDETATPAVSSAAVADNSLVARATAPVAATSTREQSLGDDEMSDEIETLSSELSSLESTMGEF